jgi:peptide subunit release factor 1 (eRF1)
MYNNESLIGVCLLSGEELRIYTVSITGSHIEPRLIKRLEIKLPNKQKKGGQSAVRFGRIADIVRNQYVNKYAENIVNSYMIENNTKCNVSKIIIAGFGYMPDDVIESALFQQFLNKYLYKKLVISSIDDLTVIKIIKDLQLVITEDLSKQVDNEIKILIDNNTEMIGFGKKECLNYMEYGNITKLYINKMHITQETKDILVQYPSLDIIETTSSQLEMYGGWLCIKKYLTEYPTN